MKFYQIVVFLITNVICEAVINHSNNENLQSISLNEGEYFPAKQEQIGYDPQFGYNLKDKKQNLHTHSDFMFTKRTEELPTPKKIFLNPTTIKNPSSLSYATIPQTKIMPVKVIQGPVKHVYLPKNEQRQLRSPKLFSGYQPAHQLSYMKPNLRYTSVDYGSDQSIQRNGMFYSTNGYRIDAPKLNEYPSHYTSINNGFQNVYPSQNMFSPGYPFRMISHEQPHQINQFINKGYQQYIPAPSQYNPVLSQHEQPQMFAPSPSYQQPNIARQGKFANLDSELTNIVNDVLNNGQGYPTHDGFTMIKSKSDNAIYLIGKPGMSLNTIPNFSAYNYASFQKSESGNEQGKTTL